MSKPIPEKLQKYPKTEHFEVIDTIGVPHPFCITPKHIDAAQKYGGNLGEAAIKDLESNGRPSCGMRRCNLMYEEHEQALLVRCNVKDNDLLGTYLKSIIEMCEQDGYAGFSFMLAKGAS